MKLLVISNVNDGIIGVIAPQHKAAFIADLRKRIKEGGELNLADPDDVAILDRRITEVPDGWLVITEMETWEPAN